jgi:hypothetical protein
VVLSASLNVRIDRNVFMSTNPSPREFREQYARVREGQGADVHPEFPRIWGEGTTACASDSKHFGAFDQNLMTEWHVRYGGRGVMILLARRARFGVHPLAAAAMLVLRVAAMIEGVLRHDTARGLTPLVWGHVSPYGTFDLDMEQRLDLDLREAA